MKRVLSVALLLLVTGCGGTGAADEGEDSQRPIDAVAEQSTLRILNGVRESMELPVVTRYEDGEVTYIYHRDPDGGLKAQWGADLRDSGSYSMIFDDDLTCFDVGGEGRINWSLMQSAGSAVFESAPWTCSAGNFGMTGMLARDLVLMEPKNRITGLDIKGSPHEPEVEDLDGVPTVHVRTNGPSQHGWMEPEGKRYDLWVGADGRLLQMFGDGGTWTFEYPESVEVELPAPDERGAYGWTHGPGMGTAKACYQSGQCPKYEPTYEWSDGRDG